MVGTLAGTSGGTLVGTWLTFWLGLEVFGWDVGWAFAEQKQKHSEGGRTKTFCYRDLAMER